MKKLLCTVLALVMLLSLASCGSKSNPGSEATDTPAESTDTLTVVLGSDPGNLDPNDQTYQSHFQVTRQTAETLFYLDENNEFVPWLCDSYEYEDDHTLVIHLKQGIKFQNGDELMASDVHFTFKRIIENNLGGVMNLTDLLLDQCEVVDDYTYKIVTGGPASLQLKLLENPASAIISERAYTESGETVGTGPYKIVEHRAGDMTTMVAFDDYWREGEPYFKNLVIRYIADSSSRAIEAESGSADIVYELMPIDMDRVDAAPGVTVMTEAGVNTESLMINTKNVADVKLREAIAYAIDPVAAVKIGYGDFGIPATGWVSPSVAGYDESLQLVKRDVERAKQCLAEAGYEPGELTLTMGLANGGTQRADMAQVFKAQLEEAGINLEIEMTDAATNYSMLVEGAYDMTIYGLTASSMEANRPLSCMVPPSALAGICAYDDPAFVEAVDASLAEPDTDKRVALYQDAIKMLIDNYVVVPVSHKLLNAAVSDSLEGFRFSISFEHHLLQFVRPAE